MIRTEVHGPLTQPLASVLTGWLGALSHTVSRVRQWPGRQRQRRALARLDERLLRDVGLTAEQARVESSKPFWRD